MTDEGDISDYLGVNIMMCKDRMIELPQPHFIQQVLEELNFCEDTKTQTTPSLLSVTLELDLDKSEHTAGWHY